MHKVLAHYERKFSGLSGQIRLHISKFEPIDAVLYIRSRLTTISYPNGIETLMFDLPFRKACKTLNLIYKDVISSLVEQGLGRIFYFPEIRDVFLKHKLFCYPVDSCHFRPDNYDNLVSGGSFSILDISTNNIMLLDDTAYIRFPGIIGDRFLEFNPKYANVTSFNTVCSELMRRWIHNKMVTTEFLTNSLIFFGARVDPIPVTNKIVLMLCALGFDLETDTNFQILSEALTNFFSSEDVKAAKIAYELMADVETFLQVLFNNSAVKEPTNLEDLPIFI